MIEFTIAGWSAWAPGLSDPQDWRQWALEPRLPAAEGVPALEEVPPMQRRRIDRLGRIALQAAYGCRDEGSANVPWIFASRHGDPARSLELMLDTARGEAVSPTSFGLSVHNAIAAMFSIATAGRGNCIALAAGKATAEAAATEAAGLLADGAAEAFMVVYDAPLPMAYAPFVDEPGPYYAWCWRLVPAGTDAGPRIALSWEPGDARDEGDAAPPLPHGLDVLRFLLSGAPALASTHHGTRWTWRRHG